jgi:predicted kinase
VTKQFVVLVGLPASGKTTYRNGECAGYAVVSSDDFIDMMAKNDGITYNESFTKYAKSATASLTSQLDEAICSGKDIVWDQTNMTRKKRVSILEKVPKGYTKTCVVILCDEEVLKNRLYNRSVKNIPITVVDNMKKSFEYPDSSEGFDYVMEVNT